MFAAKPTDGTVRWLQDCHGDTYSVVPVGDVVYSVGHAHFCANIGGFPESTPKSNYRALAVTKTAGGVVATNGQAGAHYGNFAGNPAPSLLNWFPALTVGTYTGQAQAAWSVTYAGGYLLLGGEFLSVDGRTQQGLVRFALPSAAPRAEGPVLQGEATAPTANVAGADSIDVSWPGNYDRDDLTLTCELLRDDAVVSTRITAVPFWQVAPLSYIDKGLQGGRTYSYRVRVQDPDGNVVLSPEVEVQLPQPDTSSASPSASPAPTPSG